MRFALLLLILLATTKLLGFRVQGRFSKTTPEVSLSSFNCTEAESFLDRRCHFRNVYVVGKELWLVSNTSVEVPQVLCSAVDGIGSRKCNIVVHTPEEFNARFATVRVETYETGVLFARLCPGNPYHTLFEEYLPIYELVHTTPELAHWLDRPASSNRSKLIVMQDQFRWRQLHSHYGQLLFPDVRRVERCGPYTAFRVGLLVAGTQASCVHAGHCTRGRFLTPDVGTHFRRHFLARLGLADSQPRAAPRVTVVQREGSRIFANLDEMVASINSILSLHNPARTAREVRVVDFGQMPVRAQAAVAVATDVLVLVHGGALGNVLFLPRHAVVVDVYPYSFLSEVHGYVVNGIRIAMPSMHYGHRCVETNDSSTVVLKNERCLAPNCASGDHNLPFFVTRCLYVDLAAFAAHFALVLKAWCHAVWGANPRAEAGCTGTPAAAAAVYAPPPSAAEFRARASAAASQSREGRPLCDQHVKCTAAVRQRFQPYPQCKVL
eukprot:EG_transcript_8202